MDEKFVENMNICFLEGKIISEVNFDFVYNSKRHTAIVDFIIETTSENSSKSYALAHNKVYAYDCLADKLYEKCEQGDHIAIRGRVEKSRIRITDFFQP